MKQKTIRFAWLAAAVAAAVGIVGCNAQPPSKSEPPAPQEQKAAAGGKPHMPMPSPMGTDEKPAIPLDQLAASLKNSAYDYAGLGNTIPLEYEVTAAKLEGDKTGTQILKLVEAKPEEATFTMSFTGALASQGTQEMVLKADGLYVMKVGDKVLDKPQLELPSDLSQGKSWDSTLSMNAPDGRLVTIAASRHVVGNEKLKTKAGEFDAMRVEGTLTTKVGAQSFKSQLTEWYVKGTGQVKMYVKGVNGNPKESMTVEIVKKRGGAVN